MCICIFGKVKYLYHALLKKLEKGKILVITELSLYYVYSHCTRLIEHLTLDVACRCHSFTACSPESRGSAVKSLQSSRTSFSPEKEKNW